MLTHSDLPVPIQSCTNDYFVIIKQPAFLWLAGVHAERGDEAARLRHDRHRLRRRERPGELTSFLPVAIKSSVFS